MERFCRSSLFLCSVRFVPVPSFVWLCNRIVESESRCFAFGLSLAVWYSLVCKSLMALLPLPLALLLLEASLPFLLRPPLNHFIATNRTTSCKQASLLSQHLPLLACRPSLICRYLSLLLLLFLLLIRLHATFLVWHT